MAPKKQSSSSSKAKGTGKDSKNKDSGSSAFSADKKDSKGSALGAGKKGRAIQVKQPKPWGLILTFTGVGVVALGLIGAAVFVVWDRNQPPEGVKDFYGEYANYQEVQEAIKDGDTTEKELDNPWVVQQNHVDASEDWDGTYPTYDQAPPAGGNHLSQWQTCTGMVYDGPLIDGHAVHSLEHGAVWLTYDPALVDGEGVKKLTGLIEGRDYSMMSPYPEQGKAVSIQAWGVQYQTDDLNDPKIEEFLTYYVQNSDNLAEANATCEGGISQTAEELAQQQQQGAAGMDPSQMSEEELAEMMEQMEGSSGG